MPVDVFNRLALESETAKRVRLVAGNASVALEPG